MALLNILHHPDPRLRTVAEPVTIFDAALQQFAEDMLETMYAAPGIGLAATQVNVHKKVIVIDVSEEKDTPYVFVNPTLALFGEKIAGEEGCLSVPDYFDSVLRSERVKISAVNTQGEAFTMEAEGLLSICIQHECDHLAGRLFVDYLSTLKRNRITKKLRQAGA